MPRPINLGDFEYQDVAGYPLSVDDRLQRWERTEDLHRLNRSKSPTEFPGVLELIGQRPGEAGHCDRCRPSAAPVRSRHTGAFHRTASCSETGFYSRTCLSGTRWCSLARPFA